MRQRLINRIKLNRGLLLTIAVFALVALVAITGISRTGSTVTDEQLKLLRDSLYSAAVNGYAVTGRYPTLSEIQENYGVIIDETLFDVYYYSFASNVIPEITVRIRGEESLM